MTKENALLALTQGEEEAIGRFGEINRRLASSEDLAEGIASFNERRPARFTGR